MYALLARGEKVRATKRPTSNLKHVEDVFSFYGNNAKKLLQSVTWVEPDLLNPAEVTDLLQDIHVVYHCAAMVSFAPKHKESMRMVNPAVTANLVNAALHHNTSYFAHVSSVAAIGKPKSQQETITENTEWLPGPEHSNYAVSKYYAELEIWRGIEEGLSAGIVNPSIILGPGNWHKGSSAIFKRYSENFAYYSEGSTGFVDVRDVVKILLTIADKKVTGERFIAVGKNATYRQLANLITDAYGLKQPTKKPNKLLIGLLWRAEKLRSILFGTEPLLTQETAHAAQQNWTFSNQKAQDKLGIHFTDLEKSVAEFCTYYKQQNM